MFGWFRRLPPVPPPAPEWQGEKNSLYVAHYNWGCRDIPEHLLSDSWVVAAELEYPFPGSLYADRMTFRYCLAPGQTRGFILRISGGEHIRDGGKQLYILYEMVNRVPQVLRSQIWAAWKAEREKEQAKRDLEAFAEKFRQAVEADAKRVVAALQAGKQAQLRDWLNEMKPPEALYDQLRRVVLATARDVENQREAIDRQRREEEWKREAAVREAERKVAEEREAARKRLLSGPIHFAGVVAGKVVFGTEVQTGDTFMVDVRKLQHILCVGVSGSGKSVLLQLLVRQLLELPEFEQVILVDLKDGVEFNRHRDNGKAQVVWGFDAVVGVVERLIEVAHERAAVMRAENKQLWPYGRIALVIDEFAELQTEIDTADKEEKARAKRLSANLLSLARRARAFGIIMICALQKATDDQMPSALRNNLGCKLVLRCGSNVMARSMLEIDDEYDDLPVRPTKLRDGRLYYYDARTGVVRYLQAHVVPGVELG